MRLANRPTTIVLPIRRWSGWVIRKSQMDGLGKPPAINQISPLFYNALVNRDTDTKLRS